MGLLNPRSLLTASLAFSTATNARAEVQLQAFCNMGVCHQEKLVSKTSIKTTIYGRLYAVKTEERTFPFGPSGPESANSVYRRSSYLTYVFCSKSIPTIAFNNGDSDGWTAHAINPGVPLTRSEVSTHGFYLAACHNSIGNNPRGGWVDEWDLQAKAAQLGYPLNLPEVQVELESPLEIAYDDVKNFSPFW